MTTASRALSLLALGLWIAVHSASAATPREMLAAVLERRQPNIVLILADDLGYGDLGCYGQARIRTPHIDRLAAEGTRYLQAYAGSTVCAPSRAVLMTGLHTGHCRIRGNEQTPLLPADLTIAKVLANAGYQTAVFGKWGLGRPGSTGIPTQQGFQEWLGYLDQAHAHDYFPTNLHRNEALFPIPENAGGRRQVYTPDLFARVTANYLRTAKYRPFFLFLSSTLPHANNELGAATGNGMQIPSDAPYSSESWPQAEKNKAAMITRLDADVGRVIDTLKALHMESNTVVFVTSDNGPHSEGGVKAAFHHSSGTLRGIKRDLYEGGIRVPLIAWWPGHIPAGRTSSELFAFQDFLPTAADLAGVPVPPGLDGISFRRDLLGLAQTNRHAVLYWEFHEGGSKQAVRLGDWKAVRNELGKPIEVYNLASDPGESQDVAASHPEVVARAEAEFKSNRDENPSWPLKPKPAPPTDAPSPHEPAAPQNR
jgi:arylsulfatase A-like enzyme